MKVKNTVVRYILISGLVTVVRLVIFFLLTWKIFSCSSEVTARGINAMISNAIAFVIANILSYCLNRKLVFHQSRRKKLVEGVLFLLSSIAVIGVSTLLMGVLVGLCGIGAISAFMLTLLITSGLNFALREEFVFIESGSNYSRVLAQASYWPGYIGLIVVIHAGMQLNLSVWPVYKLIFFAILSGVLVFHVLINMGLKPVIKRLDLDREKFLKIIFGALPIWLQRFYQSVLEKLPLKQIWWIGVSLMLSIHMLMVVYVGISQKQWSWWKWGIIFVVISLSVYHVLNTLGGHIFVSRNEKGVKIGKIAIKWILCRIHLV